MALKCQFSIYLEKSSFAPFLTCCSWALPEIQIHQNSQQVCKEIERELWWIPHLLFDTGTSSSTEGREGDNCCLEPQYVFQLRAGRDEQEQVIGIQGWASFPVQSQLQSSSPWHPNQAESFVRQCWDEHTHSFQQLCLHLCLAKWHSISDSRWQELDKKKNLKQMVTFQKINLFTNKAFWVCQKRWGWPSRSHFQVERMLTALIC